MSNRCADPFNIKQVPAGYKTSRRFPWWQTGVYYNELASKTAYSAVPVGGQLRLRPSDSNLEYASGAQPLFNNPMPWPIHITELRFVVMHLVNTAQPFYAGDVDDIARRIGVKFSTTMLGEVLKNFIPLSALVTDAQYAQEFETTSATMTLPDDYFMPSDADFGVDLGIFSTDFAKTASIQAGIRGCDPYNHSPVARFSDVQSVVYDVGKSGNEFTIGGNRGGQSIRNMWMRDLTFSLNGQFPTVVAGEVTGYTSFWNQLLVRLYPPQGPKWTTDIQTPLVMLNDQVNLNRSAILGTDGAGVRQSIISHKPVTPYILLPQDVLDIQSTFFSDMTYATDNPAIRYLVTAKGYQEVPTDAL